MKPETDVALKRFAGTCSCGQVSLVFSTSHEAITPRLCDCSFCQARDTAWVSDPAGALTISASVPGGLDAQRQGADLAEFHSCTTCHDLVAVTYAAGGRLYGAVNGSLLHDRALFAAPAVVSPQRLSPAQKTERWLGAWVPDVVIQRTTE